MNVPFEAEQQTAPKLRPNSHEASHEYYQMVSNRFKEINPDQQIVFPSRYEFETPQGKRAISLKEEIDHSQPIVSNPAPNSNFLEKNVIVWSSSNSGFVQFFSHKSMNVVQLSPGHLLSGKSERGMRVTSFGNDATISIALTTTDAIDEKKLDFDSDPMFRLNIPAYSEYVLKNISESTAYLVVQSM